MKHLINSLVLLTFIFWPGCTCTVTPGPVPVPAVPALDSPEQRTVKDVQMALDVCDRHRGEWTGTPRTSCEEYRKLLLKAREQYPHNKYLSEMPHSESDFFYFDGKANFTRAGQLTAAWKQTLESLPKDARIVLEKGLRCYDFGGDELSGQDLKNWTRLGCFSIDEELEKVRTMYSSNSEVIKAVNCVEETAAAHDCPASTMSDR